MLSRIVIPILEPRARTYPRRAPAAALCLAVVAACILSVLPAGAASIPSWLDKAITDWNEANPSQPFQFMDIKDSFAWYRIARSEQVGHEQVRTSLTEIVLKNGYKPTDQEELVTTGRPPAAQGNPTTKKCWSRSYTLDIDTGRQRLLTSSICEDAAEWLVGIRVVG
jgi:hypothetical protein